MKRKAPWRACSRGTRCSSALPGGGVSVSLEVTRPGSPGEVAFTHGAEPGDCASQTLFFVSSFHPSSLVSLTRHWITPPNSPEVGWLVAPSKLLNENHRITLGLAHSCVLFMGQELPASRLLLQDSSGDLRMSVPQVRQLSSQLERFPWSSSVRACDPGCPSHAEYGTMDFNGFKLFF